MLLTGVNHIASLTENVDRWWTSTRDLRCSHVARSEDRADRARHAFIALGPTTFLHAWQLDAGDISRFDGELFDCGRVDHFALLTDTKDNLQELRRRLIDVGATDGHINDFGILLSVSFHDPDGLRAEVCWYKQDVPLPGMDMSLAQDPPPPARGRS